MRLHRYLPHMSETIISTFNTINNDILRVRELTFSEKFSTNAKYVIEVLELGKFKAIKRPYFSTIDEAEGVVNKIYNLDTLLVRKKKAIAKLNNAFLESMKGTKEYDFYNILGDLLINDYEIREDNHSNAIISSDSITSNVVSFLSKYGFPKSHQGMYVMDFHISYAVILKGYDKEYCLFSTDWFEHERPEGIQYRILFEKQLSITFNKFY